MDIKELRKICKELMIIHWTINNDGSIDVDGDVNLSRKNLSKIPLKFNKVSGCFLISYNKITSLEGSPNYVGGSFYGSNNELKNLIGVPKYVNGKLSFRYNPLESLDGYDGNYDKINVDNIEKLIRKKKLSELINNI